MAKAGTSSSGRSAGDGHGRLKEHDFEQTSFGLMPTACFVCNELLNGIFGSAGFKCESCGIAVHDHCRSVAGETCYVTHRFELTNYFSIVMCAACGRPLTGLWGQGYHCAECGINVHEACRTKSSVSHCEAHGLHHPSSIVQAQAQAQTQTQTQTQAHARGQAGTQGKSQWTDKLNSQATASHFSPFGSSPASSPASPSDSSSTAKHATKSETGTNDIDSPSQPNSKPAPLSKEGSGSRTSMGSQRDVNRRSILRRSGRRNSSLNKILSMNLEEVREEVRIAHQSIIDIEKAELERWESGQKPLLKKRAATLQRQYDHLKSRQKEVQREVDQLSATRDAHFETFLKDFYQKFNASKLKDKKHIRRIISFYGNKQCREHEMLESMIQRYREPMATALLEHEKDHGILVDQELELKLDELERLSDASDDASRALEQVRRDLFFPPTRPWLVKAGTEGVYVALTSVWLSQVVGTCGIRAAMLPASSGGMSMRAEEEGQQHYTPRIIVVMGGRDEKVDFNTSTGFATASKKEKARKHGLKFSARFDELSVNGAALPMSITAREASVVVEFEVRLEAEYREDQKRWVIVEDSGFNLNLKKLNVQFKGTGAISFPEAILKSMVRTVITLVLKQLVISSAPAELGEYMIAVHRHQQRMKSAGLSSESIYGENTDEGARIALASFLTIVVHFMLEDKLDLETLDARITLPNSEEENASPQVKRVMEALGLTMEQLALFMHTQETLGLTLASLYPSDSDWLSSALGGESGGRLPLLCISDMVRYRRDFLLVAGRNEHFQVIATRLVALWQRALDIVHDEGPSDAPNARKFAMKVKRLVQRRVQRQDNITSTVNFAKLVDSWGNVDRKFVRFEAEVPVIEVAIALKGIITVIRDIVLRVALSSKGKKTVVRVGKNAIGLETSLEELRAEAEDKKQNGDEDGTEGFASTISGEAVANAIAGDRIGMEKLADANASDASGNEEDQSSSVSKRKRQQILAVFDMAMENARTFQEKVINSASFRSELVAGGGELRVGASEFTCVAMMDLTLAIAGSFLTKVLSSPPETGSAWPWKRSFTVDGDSMRLSIGKRGGLAAKNAASASASGQQGSSSSTSNHQPEQSQYVYMERLRGKLGQSQSQSQGQGQGQGQGQHRRASVGESASVASPESEAFQRGLKDIEIMNTGMLVQMKTESAVSADIFKMRMRANQSRSSSEPQVELRVLGNNAARFHGYSERVELSGGLHTMSEFIEDLLRRITARGALTIERSRTLLQGVRLLANLVHREKFFISSLANVQVLNVADAGDIYIHIQNMEDDPRKALKLMNVAPLADLIEDVQDFVTSL